MGSARPVLYHGNKQWRKDLRSGPCEHEVTPKGGTPYTETVDMSLKNAGAEDFPVVVTSYEIIIRDMAELQRYQWKCVALLHCTLRDCRSLACQKAAVWSLSETTGCCLGHSKVERQRH